MTAALPFRQLIDNCLFIQFAAIISNRLIGLLKNLQQNHNSYNLVKIQKKIIIITEPNTCTPIIQFQPSLACAKRLVVKKFFPAPSTLYPITGLLLVDRPITDLSSYLQHLSCVTPVRWIISNGHIARRQLSVVCNHRCNIDAPYYFLVV